MQSITISVELAQALSVYLQAHLTCDEMPAKKALHVSNLVTALSQSANTPPEPAKPAK